jgi:hypothetical protein
LFWSFFNRLLGGKHSQLGGSCSHRVDWFGCGNVRVADAKGENMIRQLAVWGLMFGFAFVTAGQAMAQTGGSQTGTGSTGGTSTGSGTGNSNSGSGSGSTSGNALSSGSASDSRVSSAQSGPRSGAAENNMSNAAQTFIGGNASETFVGGMTRGDAQQFNSNRQFRAIQDNQTQSNRQTTTGTPRQVRTSLRVSFPYTAAPDAMTTGRLAMANQLAFSRFTDSQPALAGVAMTLSSQGVLVLTGTTPTVESKRLAANLARLQPGVRKVDNQIQVAN